MAMAVACGRRAPARRLPGEGTGTVFSADVVVDDAIVDERGTVVETRPQTRYRMTVRRVGAGLETELVHPPARLFQRGPLMDPRGGYRYVFDDGFTNPRIYDSTWHAGQPAGPGRRSPNRRRRHSGRRSRSPTAIGGPAATISSAASAPPSAR